jgi:hypothetical protein
MLLFEADAVHRKGAEPSYRGGSGGAFEKWSTLTVGSVIAVVSPRILRPLKVRACLMWMLTAVWSHPSSSHPSARAQPNFRRLHHRHWARK